MGLGTGVHQKEPGRHGTSARSDVKTEALILVPLDSFVLPSGDIPPQIITDSPQHFPAIISLLV